MKTYDKAKEGKLRYDWLKSHGICTKCGHRDAMLGFTLCAECSYKQIVQKQKHYSGLSAEQKEKILQYKRDQRQRRIKEGLCSSCGREKENPQYKQCLECRLKCRRAHEKYAKKLKWKETGVCRYCGSTEVVEGKTLCAACLEKSRKRAIENLSKTWSDNSYFKRLNNEFWTKKKAAKYGTT